MGTATETFEQWAIVELMGHVRVAGRVTEEEQGRHAKAPVKTEARRRCTAAT